MWGILCTWQGLTVPPVSAGFSSCVGYHPEVHGGPTRANNVCQERHQERFCDDTDIWHTWQEKSSPVQEWQPRYGEMIKLCLYFHILSLVSMLFYWDRKAEEPLHAAVLETAELQKDAGSVPGGQHSSFWPERAKQKHLHLSIFPFSMNSSCCA